MVVELAEVGADEWELWRAVRLAALAEAPDAFGSTLADWSGDGDREPRWRRRLDDVSFNVVALDDGGPVGLVSGDLAPGGRVHVISMWVAPQARGTGTGDALLAGVQRWAVSEGATELALSVKRSNGPAARLYHRFGFCRTAEVDDDPTEFVMVKPLGVARAPEASSPRVADDRSRRELLRMLECDQLAARESYEASQQVEEHRGRFLFDVPADEWLPEYWAAKSTIEVMSRGFGRWSATRGGRAAPVSAMTEPERRGSWRSTPARPTPRSSSPSFRFWLVRSRSATPMPSTLPRSVTVSSWRPVGSRSMAPTWNPTAIHGGHCAES